MAKANDAADAIKRLAQQYKQMVEAAEILDKIGKAPDDEPKPRRRTLREVKIDALVERVGAKDAERALQMFLDAKSDAIPQK